MTQTNSKNRIFAPLSIISCTLANMFFDCEQHIHSAFANAKYTFENGNIVTLEFEESIVAEGKAESIVALLKEIFEVRCHIPVDIRVNYHKAKKSKIQEHNAIRLQQEINAIVEANEAKQDELNAEKK